ncbi:MAG: hypothetical protein K0Q54_5035 [Methylobacterium brachiatum]|jgi:hypothetical protein|nr:hypothetical protein [Methylobacterium brachiatum]
MDEAWKKARLNELWDAVLKLFRDPNHLVDKTRLEAAFEALNKYRELDVLHRELAEAGGDRQDDDPLLRSATAYLIWQLISVDVGAWTLREIADFGAIISSTASSRTKLKTCLQAQLNAQWPSHGRAIDPTPVFVPRSLLSELLDSIDALDHGEVHDLVKPSPKGRHGDAWSWDRMRALAVEHVAYLRGQGSAKQIARSRVAAAMSIPANSLRDWEANRELTRGYELAEAAGKLKTILDDDPRYAKGDGNTVDSHARARLSEFLSGPSLADFGRAYRATHGRRHNPGPIAGD